MSSEIPKFFRRIGPSTLCTLVIAGSTSGLLTYGGMDYMFSPRTGATWSKSVSACVALTVSVVITLAWTYTLGTVPAMERARHRRASYAAILVFLMFIFSLSSTWNVVFMAKLEVATRNLLAATQLVDNRVSAFKTVITAADALQPDLERFATDLAQKKEGESRRGDITGTPGCGGACRSIGSIAASVKILADQQKAERQKLGPILKQIDILLERLRALNENAKARNVLDRASDIASKINGLMAAAQARDRAGTILRAMETLPASFVVSRLRTKAQRDGVERFRNYLAIEAGRIATRARELQGIPPVPAISIARPNALKSVFIHWTSLVPQWSASIALDFLPLLLLFYRVTGAQSTREDDNDPDPPSPSQMSVGEVLEAQKLLDLLHGSKARKPARKAPKKNPRKRPGRAA